MLGRVARHGRGADEWDRVYICVSHHDTAQDINAVVCYLAEGASSQLA